MKILQRVLNAFSNGSSKKKGQVDNHVSSLRTNIKVGSVNGHYTLNAFAFDIYTHSSLLARGHVIDHHV